MRQQRESGGRIRPNLVAGESCEPRETERAIAVCRDLPLIHASMGSDNGGAWPEYRKRFEAKYRGRLSDGSRGRVRELRARLPRDKLAWFCEPEALQRMIARLETSANLPIKPSLA